MTNASGTFYYHRDQLRSIIDVTDASGNAQWRYEYDGYGSERTATNVSGTAPTNPLRFNGQYLDAETAHYHLRARQYDPITGRFGALDPIENPLNEPHSGSYGYVGGRPTVFGDPLGLCRKNLFSKDFWTEGNCVSDGASSAGHAVQNVIQDAVRDFDDCGGGWECAYHSFNENFNPMFKVLLSSENCGASGFGRRECLAIGRDLALAGLEIAGGGVVGRCASKVLQRALKRLGEKWGPQLQRLLREERGGPAPKSDPLPTQVTGQTARLTTAQARDLAKYSGYRPTGRFIQKEMVFTNGKQYIVQDTTLHIGGTWKIANSHNALASKTTRTSTTDALLTPIGD